jgi:hypothetical protein
MPSPGAVYEPADTRIRQLVESCDYFLLFLGERGGMANSVWAVWWSAQQ